MEIAGHTIEAFFQPYHSALDDAAPAGEILTRPDFRGLTEEFFKLLTVDQQFEILAWQLRIQEALRASGNWHASINVNNDLVTDDADRDRFLDMVSNHSQPITFEFTETLPMPAIEKSNYLLRSLREVGHMSALDDFGTGLNGMSLLTDYDFDIVKIDRSLVADLPNRVGKTETIGLVREMLAVLGKGHVVEGVESEEIFQTLRDLGYSQFQGYLFARPEPVSAFGVEIEEGAV